MRRLLGKTALFAALATALSLSAGLSRASANVVDVTFTGTVDFVSYDGRNLFGGGGQPPGGFFDGETYTSTFVFDTTQGANGSSPGESYAFGGSEDGFLGPLVSATVTLNGHTENVPGTYFNEIFGGPSGGGGNELFFDAKDFATTNFGTTQDESKVVLSGTSGTIPTSINGPLTYTLAGGDLGTANFTSEENFGNFGDISTYVTANLTGLTIQEVASATPEPATWAMLLLGVGVTGAALRAARGKPDRAPAAA
jgi:hypothetical protein